MTAPSSISDLTSHLGFWLRMVSNHVSHAFAARLAGQEVTVAEWVVMRTLHGRAPVPPSRLADDLGMTRGAITRLADRLISKGLVVRTANAKDGRAQTLALTQRGIALVPELAALADLNDAEVFGALTQDERGTLAHLLQTLAARRQIKAVPVD